jgi:arsenite-transporting ATPase
MQVRDAFKLKKVPFLNIIEGWKALAEEVTRFMRDPNNTEFILVTIPEGLGVYQARRLVREFERFGLEIRHILVNNVIKNLDSEFNRQRMEMQSKYLRMLDDEYGQRMKLIHLPLFPYEMKGVESLRGLEKELFGSEAVYRS